MSYGKIIPNLQINGKAAPYPVVNEREIRAVAGMMFLVGAVTFYLVQAKQMFWVLNWVVALFWLEFFLKAVFQPEYSLFGFVARVFVVKQKPEYVGAIQKRFAWSLGLLMASSMAVLVFTGTLGVWAYGICLTCLALMWMESALGICLGCKIYYFAVNKGWIKESEYAPACPGGACPIKKPKS
jgi:hypothetical protein